MHIFGLNFRAWFPLFLGAIQLCGSAQAQYSAVVWGSTASGKTNVPATATNLIALSAGAEHTLALRVEGSVVAWGLDTAGQTNVPAAASNILQITAGSAHNLALRTGGAMVAWGSNLNGVTNTPTAATNQPVAAIAAGASHNIVLRSNGTVFAWGTQVFGITNPPAPATNGLRIAAGRFFSNGHNLLLRRDGTVVGWGVSTYGQTNPPPTATNLVAVAAGGNFSLGLKADGTVISWGDSLSGQAAIPPSATNVVAIAAGATHALALRADGSIVGWGSNSNGKRTIPAAVSNSIAVAITAGNEHSGCLLGDGRPVFTDVLGDLVAYRNREFTLNALAVGAPPLSYQWQFNGVAVPDATNKTFTLANVQFTNAGLYSVLVSNNLGATSGVVANVSVELAQELPSILTPPLSQTIVAGSNATFNVVAAGYPTPGYQWQRNNTNILGATNTSYSIPYVLTNHAGNYRVVLSNSVGSVTSLVATLTVTVPEWPTIDSWPTNRAVSYGSPLTLSVVPTPSAGPVVYTWQLNGTNVPYAGGPTLSFGAFGVNDGGVYRVAVSNQFGGNVSPEFEIAAVPVAAWGSGSVTSLPRALTNAIAIATGAQHALALKADGQVVAWGNNLVITGVFPPLTTNNYGMATTIEGLSNIVAIAAGTYHNVVLRSDGTVAAWGQNLGGQTNVPATATNIIAVAAGDAHTVALRADGTLIAWGTNTWGQSTVPAAATNVVAIAAGSSHTVALRNDGSVLVWGHPSGVVTTVPASATNVVAISARSSYSAVVCADGRLIQWGASVPTSGLFSEPTFPATDNMGVAAGFQYGLYLHSDGLIQTLYYPGSGFLPLAPPSWLANVVGVAAGNVSLALLRPVGGLPVKQAAQRQTFLGSPAVFSAHVEGQRALSLLGGGSYQWRFNGADVSGATNRAFVRNAASVLDVGDYSVVATDRSGSITSQVANLIVMAPTLPHIVSHPVSQVAGAGSSITFNVAISYGIPAQLQWLFNEIPLPGAVNPSLKLTHIQSSNAGDYRVVISNYTGSVTSEVAWLVVTSMPPSVVSAPQNLFVPRGLPARFAVLANGSEPFAYQWQLNDADVPGATNATLLLPAVVESVLGRYRVVITNVVGAVTSSPALLALTPVTSWGTNDALARTVPAEATNAILLAAGDEHVLALRPDGMVVAWGGNSCGQSIVPAGASNVIRVAASGLHSLALQDDGTVLAWGANNSGLSTAPAGLSNAVEIAAGLLHNLALRGDGTVAAWGVDWGGNPLTPPTTATNVIAVAAGGMHSLALRADGSPLGWGNNMAGQLNFPVEATNLVAVVAGFNFSAALRADGRPVAWGVFGEVPGLTVSYACGGYSLWTGGTGLNPGPITLPADATNIVALAAGRHHLLLLRSDGAIFAVGDTSAGQQFVPPLTNAVGIAAGGFNCFALAGDATPLLGGLRSNRISGDGIPLVLNAIAGGRPRLDWQWRWFATNPPISVRPSTCFPTNAGDYHITVSNLFGAATGTISLILTSTPPRLVAHPANQQSLAGSNLIFQVQAVGSSPLTYQWQRDGTNLVDGPTVSGAATSLLTLFNVQPVDSTVYRVVVGNALGSIASSNATLVVFATSALDVALDTPGWNWTSGGPSPAQWQSATTHDGVDAAQIGPYTTNQANWIETTVTGPGAVNFWWRAFGWVPDRFIFLVDGVERISVTNDFNWQQRSFYVPDGLHTLRWTYICQPFAGDSAGWLDQVEFTNASLPTITTPPNSRSVIPGGNATFSAVVAGTEPFSYQWRFNGVDLAGATNAVLTLTGVQMENAGNYQIVVTNLLGSVTSQVAVLTLTMSPPVVQAAPNSVVAAPGTTASFTSTVLGSAPLARQWQFERVDVPSATNATLTLSNVQPSYAGSYRIVGSNELGTTVSSEGSLSIVPVAAWGLNQQLQTRVPVNVGKVIGIAAGFGHSAAVREDGQVATWGSYSIGSDFGSLSNRSFIAIAGAGNHDIGLRADGTVAIWGQVSGLSVPPGLANVVAVATGGAHDLALRADGTVATWGLNNTSKLVVPYHATNLVAIAAGSFVSLGVRDNGELIGWGESTYGQLDLPTGSDFVSVAAAGGHALALRMDGTVVAWGMNESGQTNVPTGLSNIVSIAAGGQHSLALRGDGKVFAWGRNDAGQCTVWDTLTNIVAVAGGSSHSLALVGDGQPVITIAPQRRRLEAGGSTMLKVFTTGAGPLSYQWQLNGTNVPGATNATLLTSRPGLYTVTASNSLGTVKSPTTTITIAQSTLRFDLLPDGVVLAADGLHLRLLGASGRGPVVLLASTDFVNWLPIRTNPPATGQINFVDPDALFLPHRYYRAVEMETVAAPTLRLMSPSWTATATGALFQATVAGLTGSGAVTIYGSSNLKDWTAVASNPPVIGEWKFEHLQLNAATLFWYRAAEQR